MGNIEQATAAPGEVRRARRTAGNNDKVALAYPYGDFEPHFVQSLAHFFAYDHHHHARVVEGAVIQLGTTNVAHGRNQIVAKFLDETRCDWLWFVDTDMAFQPDTLDRLLESADAKERPIVGALCFALMKGDQQEVVPTLYSFTEDDPPVLGRMMQLPPDGLHRMAATGTGCLLIHRSVLATLRDHSPGEGQPKWGDTSWPWFRFSDWAGPDGPDVMGEDLTFCLRAGQAGFPVYVDTRIKVGHVKPVVIDEATYHAQFGAPRRPVFVVVPVKDRRDLTENLLRQLVAQGQHDRVFVMDNGSNTTTKNWLSTLPADWRVTVVDADGWGIHRMWNEGVRLALAESPACDIAILNNDLNIGPDFLAGLVAGLHSDDRLLAVCPNYDNRPADTPVVPLRGIAAGLTDGQGGLAGFAFMVRGEMFTAGFPLFDEAMVWYSGDLDFVLTVEKFGGWCGMVTGTAVEHIGNGSQTASHGTGKRLGTDELRAQAAADEAYLCEKWGITLEPAS